MTGFIKDRCPDPDTHGAWCSSHTARKRWAYLAPGFPGRKAAGWQQTGTGKITDLKTADIMAEIIHPKRAIWYFIMKREVTAMSVWSRRPRLMVIYRR